MVGAGFLVGVVFVGAVADFFAGTDDVVEVIELDADGFRFLLEDRSSVFAVGAIFLNKR